MSDTDNHMPKHAQSTNASLYAIPPGMLLNAFLHALFACLAFLILIARSVHAGLFLIGVLLLDIAIEYFLYYRQQRLPNTNHRHQLTLRILFLFTLLGTITGSTAGFLIQHNQPVLRVGNGAIIPSPQPNRIRIDPAHLHADGGLAFSSDGLRIALGIPTGVEIWNQQRDTLNAQYSVPFSSDAAVHALALSWSTQDTSIAIAFSHIPSGKSEDSTEFNLVVWNAATGAIEMNQSLSGPMTYITWSPNEKILSGYLPPKTMQGVGVIELWNITTKQALTPLFLQGVPAASHEQGSDPVFSWSPDSTRIIAVNNQRFILMIDVTLEDIVERFTDSTPVLSLSWSPDGKSIVTGHADGSITFWDAASLTATQTFMTQPTLVMHLLWQADNQRLLSATNTAISVIDIVHLRTIAVLRHNVLAHPTMTPISLTPISLTATPLVATAASVTKAIATATVTPAATPTTPLRNEPEIVAIDISFNGSQIGALYSDGSLFLWGAKEIGK